jgi:hypothetical protein
MRLIASTTSATRSITCRRPICGQDDDRQIPASQILLRINVLIVSNQNVESLPFCTIQKLSVSYLLPRSRIRRNRKTEGFERGCKMSRHPLIEEHALRHEGSSGIASLLDLLNDRTGEFDCCNRSLALQTWIGIEDIVERHPICEILK